MPFLLLVVLGIVEDVTKMRNFDIKQETVRYYRELLELNPVNGVSVLYRKHDTKHIDSNYVEISFLDLHQVSTHTGDKQTLRIYFDIISTNEIKVENIAGGVKKLFFKGKDTNNFELHNLRFDMGIAKIDNNRFVRRLTAEIYFHECLEE